MQTRIAHHIDRDDATRLEILEQAFSLVGGCEEIDAKSFSRIKGNDFTYEDALAAVSVIRLRAEEMVGRLEQPIFTDAKVQAGFAEGVKANARLAVRMADEFLDDLNMDIAEAKLIGKVS